MKEPDKLLRRFLEENRYYISGDFSEGDTRSLCRKLIVWMTKELATPPAATDGFVMDDQRDAWVGSLDGAIGHFEAELEKCELHALNGQSLLEDKNNLESLRDWLAAAPQSGKKEDWISVKERLPELTGRDDSHVPGGAPATLYSESVLVFDGTVRIDNLIQAEGDPETTTFYVGTCDPITHWMPLPSPPSKADGE